MTDAKQMKLESKIHVRLFTALLKFGLLFIVVMGLIPSGDAGKCPGGSSLWETTVKNRLDSEITLASLGKPDKKHEKGKTCVGGKEPNPILAAGCDYPIDHAKVNAEAKKNFGDRCENGNCQFVDTKGEFICRSSSIQAMHMVIASVMVVGICLRQVLA